MAVELSKIEDSIDKVKGAISKQRSLHTTLQEVQGKYDLAQAETQDVLKLLREVLESVG